MPNYAQLCYQLCALPELQRNGQVVVISSIPLAESVDNMQTTQIELTFDGPTYAGEGHIVLREFETLALPELHEYSVKYELNVYHLNNLKQQQLQFSLGNTYTFEMNHVTMPDKPLVLLDSNRAVYTVGVIFMLDDVVQTAAQYLAGFQAATSRQLIITPTSVVALTYDCYVEQHHGIFHEEVGSSIIINDPSSVLIDVHSTATADGISTELAQIVCSTNFHIHLKRCLLAACLLCQYPVVVSVVH